MAVIITKPAVNIREKLAELERPIGVNGAALMATNTPQDAFSLIGAGRRNVIINGDFRFSQRGIYTTATSASTNTYYLDRWNVDISGVTATIQQQTSQTITSDIIANTAKLAATSTATGYLQLRQKVELDSNLYGKTVTVSAWVRSNRNARLRLEGGSNYDSLTSHSGNGGWEYLTMTVNLQTSPSAITFGVIVWGGTGGTTGGTTTINSGDYLEFTNFQVEIGKVATPFEYRNYGQELAFCQRYYYNTMFINGADSYTAPTTNYMEVQGTRHRVADVTGYQTQVIFHPVIMRSSPNITLYNPGNSGASGQVTLYNYDGTSANSTAVSAQKIRPGSFAIWAYTGVTVGTAGMSVIAWAHWAASSEL